MWTHKIRLTLMGSQSLLIHVPDVCMPLPGTVVAFPVDNVLDWDDLATRQSKLGAANLDLSVPR
jgi:hypothetical protein